MSKENRVIIMACVRHMTPRRIPREIIKRERERERVITTVYFMFDLLLLLRDRDIIKVSSM